MTGGLSRDSVPVWHCLSTALFDQAVPRNSKGGKRAPDIPRHPTGLCKQPPVHHGARQTACCSEKRHRWWTQRASHPAIGTAEPPLREPEARRDPESFGQTPVFYRKEKWGTSLSKWRNQLEPGPEPRLQQVSCLITSPLIDLISFHIYFFLLPNSCNAHCLCHSVFQLTVYHLILFSNGFVAISLVLSTA